MDSRSNIAVGKQPGSSRGYGHDGPHPISLPSQIFGTTAAKKIREDRTLRRTSSALSRGDERAHRARRLSSGKGAGHHDASHQLALHPHRNGKKRTSLSDL